MIVWVAFDRFSDKTGPLGNVVSFHDACFLIETLLIASPIGMSMQRIWAREIESSRHAITQNELLAQFHSLIPRHDEAGPPSPCLKDTCVWPLCQFRSFLF